MGLLRKVSQLSSRWFGAEPKVKRRSPRPKLRLLRVEELERREMMAADLHLGAIYFDPGDGIDNIGNEFTVTFNGGAANTQLTQLTIDTDLNHNGTVDPLEMYFDTAPGGLGVSGSTPFELGAHNGFTVTSYSVSDGGQQLTLHFNNFTAGDRLFFRLDVDQKRSIGSDPVVEGAEFEQSALNATFQAPNYQDANGSDVFLWQFNQTAAANLGLPLQNYLPSPPERDLMSPLPIPLPPNASALTAGAFYSLPQTPLPSSISGHVQLATNGLCDDPGSTVTPLAGVTMLLLDASGNQVLDSHGNLISTTTDSSGNYSFTNLLPGTYSVKELQPSGYLQGDSDVGTVGGVLNGTSVNPDLLSNITLVANDAGIDYDFCEQLPVSIGGRVVVATGGTCDDPGATLTPLPGVTVLLLDASGHTMLDSHGNAISTVTAANGTYSFTNLAPATYGVRELIPAGYFAGDADLGTVNGLANGVVVGDDRTLSVVLKSGNNGLDYDFCLQLPVSISGRVVVSTNGTCDDPGATLTPLPGVTVILLDAAGHQMLDSHGNVISTVTAADGTYVFANLAPGTYGVHDVLPPGYVAGDADVGTVGGTANGTAIDNQNTLHVVLTSGDHGIDYDFCVQIPPSISGYVFQDGGDIVLPLGQLPSDVLNNLGVYRDGLRTSDDTMLGGQILVLADAHGTPLHDAHGNLITTATDATGHYIFSNLDPGTYTVIYAGIPADDDRGFNTPGSTGGVVTYPGSTIALITVTSGTASVENDFSVVHIVQIPIILIPPPTPTPPPAALNIGPQSPPPTPVSQIIINPVIPAIRGYTGGNAVGFTWHLSVINAGRPRGNRAAGEPLVQVAARLGDPEGWNTETLADSSWSLNTGENATDHQDLVFGMRNGIPITGDFNGDGNTDVGIYHKGYWYIDLNGNGVWDKEDLWAKLGYDEDLPITGDWDGDGKTDIGIYGRAWPGDPKAIREEPGLPNPDNVNTGVRKNAPLDRKLTVVGSRSMQRTSTGKVRDDVIDHVFAYGAPGDYPIAGNWNGSGIDTIGIFRDGLWKLDIDGNGKWSEGDETVHLGQEGDKPVVGDFNGDGVDELGVYRNGTWHIDANGDRVLDDRDMIIKFGGPNDEPVVGDWNGDGRDEVGVYQNGQVKPRT